MLVRVLAVLSVDPCRVRFTSDAGEAEALWRAAEPPAAGTDVRVELDADAALSWDGSQALASDEPGRGELWCRVEGVEADGVVVARLGPGLTQLELAPGQRLPEVGAVLVLRDVPLSLWPVSC